MKKIITACMIIFFFNPCIAQKKGAFMRVYDSNHKKIYAGRLLDLTDTSFFLNKNNSKKEISATEVRYIKMKHSTGHSVLIAGGIGAAGLAILGGIAGEPTKNDGTFEGAFDDLFTPTPGEGAAFGFVAGAMAGSLAGAIIGAVKKKPLFIIKNDISNWPVVKTALQQYLPQNRP